MNRIAIPALLLLFLYQTAPAQPPKAFEYSVGQVLLPDEMNKQVCISGMKSYRNELYFASERCPYILVFNPEKKIRSNSLLRWQ